MRSNARVSREGSKLTRDINVHLYARVDLLCVNGTEIENRVALGAIIAGQLERATFVARLGLNYRDGCAAWKILSRSIDHRELVCARSLLFPTSLSLFNAHWGEHSFPFSTKFCAGKFGSTLNWTQFRRLKALIGKVISNHDVKCDVRRETD